jgi:hypothetical protein
VGDDRAVEHADDLRRDGEVTWEEYATLLRGKFSMRAGRFVSDFVKGKRDRQGRLRELKDLGGR